MFVSGKHWLYTSNQLQTGQKFQKTSNFVPEFIWISENFKHHWISYNNFLQDIRWDLVPRNIDLTQFSKLRIFLILEWQR